MLFVQLQKFFSIKELAGLQSSFARRVQIRLTVRLAIALSCSFRNRTILPMIESAATTGEQMQWKGSAIYHHC